MTPEERKVFVKARMAVGSLSNDLATTGCAVVAVAVLFVGALAVLGIRDTSSAEQVAFIPLILFGIAIFVYLERKRRRSKFEDPTILDIADGGVAQIMRKGEVARREQGEWEICFIHKRGSTECQLP
jgi:hypothetical protein